MDHVGANQPAPDDPPPPDRPIRVAIVDDRPPIRVGLEAILRKEPGMRVVRIPNRPADDPIQLVGRFDLDVLLLGVGVADVDGFNLPRRIHVAYPSLPLLIVGGFRDHFALDTLSRACASGYVPVTARAAEFGHAVRALAAGQTYIHTALAAPDRGDAPVDLTEREDEILRLLALGHSTREIAVELNIAVKTVESHVAAILTELGVHSRAQIIIEAYRRGLIHLAGPRG